ncbi:MAG: hypothetical protein ABIA04_14700 [Pseudomonadota bacterium]
MKVFRNEAGLAYHVPVAKSSLNPNLLTCGSPERVLELGSMLKNKKVLTENRGLPVVNGEYEGLPITVFCTGMGPATTSIVIPEIIDSIDFSISNTANIIRLGTSGSMQDHVKPCDIVVSSASIRDEGTSDKIIGKEFPAVSDIKLSLSLMAAGEKNGLETNKTLWLGTTHVKDELYFTENPENSPIKNQRVEALDSFKKLGCLATEMELSPMILIANYYNEFFRKNGEDKKVNVSGAFLVISGNHGTDSETTQFQKCNPSLLLELGLDALKIYRENNITNYENILKNI